MLITSASNTFKVKMGKRDKLDKIIINFKDHHFWLLFDRCDILVYMLMLLTVIYNIDIVNVH